MALQELVQFSMFVSLEHTTSLLCSSRVPSQAASGASGSVDRRVGPLADKKAGIGATGGETRLDGRARDEPASIIL